MQRSETRGTLLLSCPISSNWSADPGFRYRYTRATVMVREYLHSLYAYPPYLWACSWASPPGGGRRPSPVGGAGLAAVEVVTAVSFAPAPGTATGAAVGDTFAEDIGDLVGIAGQ